VARNPRPSTEQREGSGSGEVGEDTRRRGDGGVERE
jgi:hypothetical protein